MSENPPRPKDATEELLDETEGLVGDLEELTDEIAKKKKPSKKSKKGASTYKFADEADSDTEPGQPFNPDDTIDAKLGDTADGVEAAPTPPPAPEGPSLAEKWQELEDLERRMEIRKEDGSSPDPDRYQDLKEKRDELAEEIKEQYRQETGNELSSDAREKAREKKGVRLVKAKDYEKDLRAKADGELKKERKRIEQEVKDGFKSEACNVYLESLSKKEQIKQGFITIEEGVDGEDVEVVNQKKLERFLQAEHNKAQRKLPEGVEFPEEVFYEMVKRGWKPQEISQESNLKRNVRLGGKVAAGAAAGAATGAAIGFAAGGPFLAIPGLIIGGMGALIWGKKELDGGRSGREIYPL